MAVNTYECLLIFDSNRFARDQGGVSGQIERFVKNAGGEMLVSRLWEERRLAFPIQGHRKGTYWLTYFKVEAGQIPAIERECQLSESILRSLILKVNPRIADTLVSHAQGAAPVKTATPPLESSSRDEAVEELKEEDEASV